MNKFELIKYVSDLSTHVGMELDGPMTFKTIIRPGVECVIRFSIVGSGILELNCDAGCFIEKIEHYNNILGGPKAESFKISQTIFQRSDLFLYGLGIDGIRSFELNNTGAIASYIELLKHHIFLQFSECESAVNFIKNNFGLALGHHAFRVPIILKSAKEYEVLQKYIIHVKSFNFIDDFEEYLTRLDSKNIDAIW